MSLEEIADIKCFGGRQLRCRHRADVLGCDMTFSLYLPPQVERGQVPLLWWLSGLTCTDENFTTKAGAQRFAARYGIAIIAPDTSPRGDDVADDPAYDLGQGAGFYVNATREPWAAHYRMYDYVVDELPALIADCYPVDTARAAIAGHSMGGHGALTMALANPGRYRSISAFAPICAPSECPWGEKAFSAYLGDDRAVWREHDASVLIGRAAEQLPLLIDQGGADGFLAGQLLPQRLLEAAAAVGYPVEYRLQRGYDHSYYFIASFIEDHFRHHAVALGVAA